MKLQQKVKVRNGLGLHARPATSIARLLQQFTASVTFTHRQTSVDARSIMNLLMLSASKNAQIVITCEGEDAQEAMASLIAAFENCFGEM